MDRLQSPPKKNSRGKNSSVNKPFWAQNATREARNAIDSFENTRQDKAADRWSKRNSHYISVRFVHWKLSYCIDSNRCLGSHMKATPHAPSNGTLYEETRNYRVRAGSHFDISISRHTQTQYDVDN